MSDFRNFLEDLDIPFRMQVDLKYKTRIRQGGMCDYWIVPETLYQLETLVRYLYSHKLKFEIVGQTTNLFFKSSFHAFVIISTIKLSKYIIDGDDLVCECGVSVIKIARMCVDKGYKGYYGLVGLPGTVGAAIYNNSGCYDCSLSSMLSNIVFLNENGNIEILDRDSMIFDHRSSILKRRDKRGVILSVRLKIYQGKREDEIDKARKVMNFRKCMDEQSPKTLGSIYSISKPKLSVRIIMKVLRIVNRFYCFDIQKAKKNILLNLYGYKVLNRYVSDRNLNTFIWRDSNAEMYFEKYKKFMEDTNEKLIMEIEIKS